MSSYTMNGRQILSDKGKIVATLDADGNPVMAPGMAGPHSAGVKEFLADSGNTAPRQPAAEQPAAEQPAAESQTAEQPAAESSTDEWIISTIPESELPPFSKALGVYTPGFSEYIKEHKLTEPQVAALVKRLSM